MVAHTLGAIHTGNILVCGWIFIYKYQGQQTGDI